MIVLRPTEMRWIDDDPTDHCAHGRVVFTIDSTPFASGEDAEEITVSAAALFLLRTLTHDHRAARPVAEGSQLFPHCGFSAYEVSGRFPVLVMGCNVGVDPEVIHSDGTVTIRSQDGQEATVTDGEWRHAVLGFVNDVQAFYDASPSRVPFNESAEDEGWRAFWEEWRDLKAAAEGEHRL
jgi:hypothetical protein